MIKSRLPQRMTAAILIGWLLTVVNVASAAEDVAGSHDLGSLVRYPNSWIVDFSQHNVAEYALATGSMKKVNGVIAPESLRYVSGRLTRITYQLPTGHTSAGAANHFQRQFDKLPHEVLFRCEARVCGESNQWANIQFGIAKLYGIDREQHYAALMLQSAGAEPDYLAFYTVKRGNKKVYAHIDLIEAESQSSLGASQPSASLSSTALVAGLQRGMRVYLQADQVTEADAAALRQLLQGQPEVQLLLVGHSDQAANSAQNTTRQQQQTLSLQLAEALKQRLQAFGVEASQLQADGVGALAPAYDDSVPDQRVELLLRSR